jgi:hypothetical protein
MKRLQYVPLLFLMFLSLGVASVFGNAEYPIAQPILGTTGSPALASPSLYSGVISVLYADGATVVLSSNHVNLELCSTTTCDAVTTTLKQTSPGTYSYSFTPPSLNGTITIYVQSGSLADDNGRIFPSVNTQIGTYASPTTGTLSATGTSHPSLPATAPNQAKPAGEIRQAVQAAHTTQASPILGIVAVLGALVVAACLILRPWRR